MPDLSATGPRGSRVTAKFVINSAELQAWSRVFMTTNVEKLSAELVQAVKVEAPVRTGWLRSNIKPAPIRFIGPHKAEGGAMIDKTDVPYAGYVRWGTKPHVIRPRHATVLKFWWDKVGGTVFFKKVNHPGTKPNTFMERGVQRVARGVRW